MSDYRRHVDLWLANLYARRAENPNDPAELDALINATLELRNSTDGLRGSDGQSAYQIWKALGNTGTEAQFLEALKGRPGDAGNPGLSAYQVWLAAGNTGTPAQYLASLKGAAGTTVQSAAIDPATGRLTLTLNTGTVIDAGPLPAGSALARRTGGAPGVVVLSGAAWVTPGATEYARYGSVLGVLGADDAVAGYRQGHTLEVTGWGLTTGTTYYLPRGVAGGYANWLPIPAAGLGADTLPGQGQVRLILGTVRAEGARQFIDLRPDGLDFGAPPPAFANYRELWSGVANGTNLATAGKLVTINSVGAPSVVNKYDTTGTATQIGAGFPAAPNSNFAVQIGYAKQNIRALAAAPALAEGRQLVTWAVGTSDGTSTSMDGVLFGLSFSVSATEHYVAQFYGGLLRIEKQVYSASDFSAGTTITMTPLMTSVAVDSASLKTYNTEMVVTPENGQIRIQVFHWLEGAAMPVSPQVNLLVAATGTGRFGYTLRQQYLRVYKFDIIDKASGVTYKGFA